MSDPTTESTSHPGRFIKQSVIPQSLSVKKAAEMLGVGRPALSNLLNGNSALSPEMALRIQKAFGANAEELLKKQASYDKIRTHEREKEVAVRAYAPSFMAITAAQIAAWADRTEARSVLPALLRRLVKSTGTNLTKVDFPAYDNAQRHGWDGQLETDNATPWIPSGISGWEFGCDQNPRQKAESDYLARGASVASAERKKTTFVFVTPRNWHGKDEWAKEKRAKKVWKDVRAFDASDIEQWLEQSATAQVWIAEKLGIDSGGVLSLDECWDRWAKVTKPELSKELFRGAVESYKNKISPWLTQPPSIPFVIAADSADEALAFLACALEAIGTPTDAFAERAIVLRTVEALKKTTKASSGFIAIIASPEVEAASAGLHQTQHTVIIRLRNAVEGEPNVALDLLDDKTFKAALIAMGIDEDDVPRYERESGQSPTILRRRLSVVPAIKFPVWSQDKALARKLIALGFAGVWNSGTKADQEIMHLLSGDEYPDIEKSVAELLRTDQTPVWALGRYRGVASKIDTLYATHSFVTRDDLETFFFAAQVVLSEKDPALELPEDKRWAANIYGKTRDHSAALREGICETLVVLSVHGNNLFRERLGIDVLAHVNKLVRDLLIPLNAETWASQQHDLPRYAEAAPKVFLDILEQDLASNDPQILSLLRPVDGGMFGSCPRSGLLWALETLAWKPERLLRVVLILAKLSEQKIEDNWVNKPENSLSSIFRSWMPQTAANVGQRIAVLEKLVEKFPDLGWRLCIEQFESHAIGHYSNRPRWRNDAAGAGQPVTYGEIHQFQRKALDIALEWPAHDERTLGDLIEHLLGLADLPEDIQIKGWGLVDKWAKSGPDESLKATLRETIRRFAFTKRGRRDVPNHARELAKQAYDSLEASDPVVRHRWLFAQQWVEESYEELEEEEIDFKKRDERIGQQRQGALREVWGALGYDGIVRLCESGDASWTIGWHLADGLLSGTAAEDFLYRLVSEGPPRASTKLDLCIAGFLAKSAPDARDALLPALIQRFDGEGMVGDDKKVHLLRYAPFGRQTWEYVDKLSETLSTRYWREVTPQWVQHDPDELHIIIDRLLAVDRPRAAFSTVRFGIREVSSEDIIRLLREVATNDAEPSGHYRFQGYEIEQAIEALESRSNVSRDEKTQLEFMYLSALEHGKRGIPNLERQLAANPALFVQAVGLVYVRKDGGEDPPEWGRPKDPEAARSVATQAYRLLHKAKRIPGTRDDGSINADELKAWIVQARTLCKSYGREVTGDLSIGDLLAKSPPGADGIWPAEAVRQVLDQVGTEDIARGMATGLYNLRGAHFRGPGGAQERDLAAKYRGWSRDVAFESPFVSRLLDQIAQTYDREAVWHDTDANIRKRLPY